MGRMGAPEDFAAQRAALLAAEGYSPEQVRMFAAADRRVATRIAVEADGSIQPLSNAESKLVRQWVTGHLSAAEIAARILARRALHAGRPAGRAHSEGDA